MTHPYEAAVQALQTESTLVRTLSNNLVNAASTGFKRGVAVAQPPFANQLGAQQPGPRALVAEATDFRQGPLRQTGEATHLALEGRGFFELRAADKVLYTRSGAFTRDATGRLVDGQGFALQGIGGDVLVGAGAFSVEADGTVVVENQPKTRLRMLDFNDPSQLRRTGGASFEGGLPTEAKAVTVRQGYLEASNVVSSHEMVQLMEAVKRFEFGHRIVQAQDDMLERSIRKLSEN